MNRDPPIPAQKHPWSKTRRKLRGEKRFSLTSKQKLCQVKSRSHTHTHTQGPTTHIFPPGGPGLCTQIPEALGAGVRVRWHFAECGINNKAQGRARRELPHLTHFCCCCCCCMEPFPNPIKPFYATSAERGPVRQRCQSDAFSAPHKG